MKGAIDWVLVAFARIPVRWDIVVTRGTDVAETYGQVPWTIVVFVTLDASAHAHARLALLIFRAM